MNSLDNLNVTLVFPDLMAKTKLREVLKNILYKAEMNHARDLRSLSKDFADNLTPKTDFIFISSKWPQADISAFLSGLKSLGNQPVPAVVICLPGVSFDSSGLVAGWYLEGAAGFISEPFTADDISELLNTIREDRKKAVDQTAVGIKARKAAKFLLNDAVSLVDELAKLRSNGKEGGYTLKSLKSLHTAFANFYEQDPAEFAIAIADVFEKVKPPAVSNQQLSQKKTTLKVIKHPGTLIWEIMNKRSLAEDRMAELLKLEVKDLNDLLWGKANITEQVAQNLSRALGMSPREWMKLQSEFDLYQQKAGAAKEQ